MGPHNGNQQTGGPEGKVKEWFGTLTVPQRIRSCKRQKCCEVYGIEQVQKADRANL